LHYPLCNGHPALVIVARTTEFMDQELYLIVEKEVGIDDRLGLLLAEGSASDSLDAFTTRQRLTGRGLALFAKGQRPDLENPARRLRRHGFKSWLLLPSPPRFSPPILRSLSAGQDGISFETHRGKVTLGRGEAVLAVLADLSGKVIEKGLRRLLVQNAYRGVDHATEINEDEQYQAILRASPVLDLYLLDAEGSVVSSLRVFPGKFNPAGLGTRATYSSAGNLEGLLHLTREYAGDFTLRTDFGLAHLPGCLLKMEGTEEERQRANLLSLSRFGSLMVDLRNEDLRRKDPAGDWAAALSATTGLAAGPTGLLVEEILFPAGAVGSSEVPRAARIPEKKEGLPLPPPQKRSGRFSVGRIWLGTGGAGAAFLLPLLSNGSDWIWSALYQGIRTGILPTIAAGSLFGGGFYYLRLKRLVENTPTSKTRSVAMGMVEVQGRAVRQYALVSPMSQLACVYYRVRKYVRGDNANWRLSSETESGQVPFFLQDETGRVQVNPEGATVRPRTRNEGLPGRMGLLMATSGITDANEKWVEEVIAEGTFLYVLGFARSGERTQLSLREQTIAALRSLKSDPLKLKRFDTDGDGHISPEEWEGARTEIEAEVVHRSLSKTPQASLQGDRVVIARPQTKSLPFVIAETESEAHLTRNYSRIIFPLLTGAFATALWAVVQILGILKQP
jgi:hypothetical protein